MRALITGDLHLTSNPRDAYRFEIFPFLAKAALARKCDAVFILGDITDRKDKHDSRLVNRVVHEMNALARPELGLRVYIVMGNHDYTDSTMPFFGFLRHVPGVQFISMPDSTIIRGERVTFLPHNKKPREMWVKSAHLRKALRKSKLVLTHVTVRKAMTSNGARLTGLENIPAGWFRKRTKGVVVSGDVHVPQRIGGVTYAGAPYPVHNGDDYEPRVLFYNAGRLISIPRKTLRKLHLEIEGPEQVQELKRLVRPEDQLRLVVRLPRASFHLFADIRNSVRTWCKDNKIDLHGVELRASDDETSIVEPGKVKSIDLDKILSRYVKANTIMDGAEFAASVLDEVKAENPPRTSCGDFDLLRLTIQGFKSYDKQSAIDFPRQHGLVFLGGRNKDFPKLGANGTGKSTVLDAVRWCLYGRTMQGLRGPNVVAWDGTQPTEVTAECVNSTGHFTVRRTQAPNTLTLQRPGQDPIDVTDDELAKIVGLTIDEFTFVVLMGQFGEFFFDLKDTERLSLFSSILGLDVWETAALKAREHEKAAQETCASLRSTLDMLVGRETAVLHHRDQAEKTYTELKASSAKWIAANEAIVFDLKDKADSTGARLTKMRSAITTANDSNRAAERTIEQIDARISKLRTRESVLQTQAQGKRDTLSSLSDLRICPTCEQPVPKAAIRARTIELNTALEQIAAEVQTINLSLRDQINSRTQLKSALTDTNQLRTNERTLSDEHNQLLNKITETTNRLQHAKKASDTEKQRLEQAEKELGQVRGEIKQTKKRLAMATTREVYGAFWTENFRKIRLGLITDALDELAADVNNAAGLLGLDGWKIEFSVEREKVTKGTAFGFFTFIRSPHSPDRVPWEAWCGGETQRLRVASAIALANLVSSRLGTRSGVEFWDEPTQHLSEEGVADVVDFLAERAQSEGKQVWLVDHRAPACGGFAMTYEVVKIKGHSRIRKVSVSTGE